MAHQHGCRKLGRPQRFRHSGLSAGLGSNKRRRPNCRLCLNSQVRFAAPNGLRRRLDSWRAVSTNGDSLSYREHISMDHGLLYVAPLRSVPGLPYSSLPFQPAASSQHCPHTQTTPRHASKHRFFRRGGKGAVFPEAVTSTMPCCSTIENSAQSQTATLPTWSVSVYYLQPGYLR